MKVPVKTTDIINSDLWKLFPIINVDKIRDIPKDYPGAMGVPITFLAGHDHSQFQIIDMLRPKMKGKVMYARILVRNLHPDLPEVIDMAQWLEKTGSDFEICNLEEY